MLHQKVFHFDHKLFFTLHIYDTNEKSKCAYIYK